MAYGLGRRVVLAGSLRAGGPRKRGALVWITDRLPDSGIVGRLKQEGIAGHHNSRLGRLTCHLVIQVSEIGAEHRQLADCFRDRSLAVGCRSGKTRP